MEKTNPKKRCKKIDETRRAKNTVDVMTTPMHNKSPKILARLSFYRHKLTQEIQSNLINADRYNRRNSFLDNLVAVVVHHNHNLAASVGVAEAVVGLVADVIVGTAAAADFDSTVDRLEELAAAEGSN
jgi:hypothetical protein